MKCRRLLLDVRDKYPVPGGFMLSLDDHDAQALFAFVDPQLAFGRKPVKLLALEYLGERRVHYPPKSDVGCSPG